MSAELSPADLASPAAISSWIPPRVQPPRAALPLWRFLPAFLKNPLRGIPEPVYHEAMFVPSSMRGRMAWITDPGLVEQVLLRQADKFSKTEVERRIFEPIVGGGILTANGQDWRWQRRLLAPLFRPSELLTFVPQMTVALDHLLARWATDTQGRVRRIDDDMTDLTFDVLTSTLFAGCTEAEGTVLKSATGKYLERTSWEIAFEILQFPKWLWHPYKREMRRAAHDLQSTLTGLVARERTKGWASGGLGAKLGAAVDPDTGQSMSDAMIVANLGTFAAAGHETTAKALTWALYLIARVPHWQNQIRDEVARVVGSGVIEARHIDDLVVTRQVLEEAMRLYPPAPVMTRQAIEEVTLGGRTFAAGSLIVIPVYVIQRHRALWERPDEFDPTRFAPERAKTYLRTQFMPFGFGPRICIGMSFAMIEATLLLAGMVRGADFFVDENVAPEPLSRVTLRPRGGMPMRVATRK